MQNCILHIHWATFFRLRYNKSALTSISTHGISPHHLRGEFLCIHWHHCQTGTDALIISLSQRNISIINDESSTALFLQQELCLHQRCTTVAVWIIFALPSRTAKTSSRTPSWNNYFQQTSSRREEHQANGEQQIQTVSYRCGLKNRGWAASFFLEGKTQKPKRYW